VLKYLVEGVTNVIFIFFYTGRKGAVIQKLRDEYGVQINVPPSSIEADDEKANQIKLVGYEQKCERAKAAIENMIRELVGFFLCMKQDRHVFLKRQ